MDFWDEVEGQRTLSSEELEERVRAKSDYKKWAIIEETSWRQKSREIWLKEGDSNTRFFHRMANSHRRRNTINKIKINEWLTEDSRIRQGIVEAFENLLSEPRDWRASLMNLSFSRITKVEVASLEGPLTEEEVKATLTKLNGDKAPGPDSFTTAFWQHCWDIVKEEVLLMFKDFHEKARFVRSLNSTFIVLVPNKGGAEDIKDFRPIILVNSLYKLIAKVLANKLKSYEQTGQHRPKCFCGR